MLQAFALGAIAQSSLLLSGVIPFVLRIPDRIVGILAGIGAGALIAAVAFDLVPESIAISEVALWFFVGAGIFLVADRIIEERFGGDDDRGGGGPLGIVLGSVVDGVPESLIFGIQLAAGIPISIAFFAAVFVSNVPQALAPSADLIRSGWKPPADDLAMGRGGARLRRRVGAGLAARDERRRRDRCPCRGDRRRRPAGDAHRVACAVRL